VTKTPHHKSYPASITPPHDTNFKIAITKKIIPQLPSIPSNNFDHSTQELEDEVMASQENQDTMKAQANSIDEH